MKIIVTGGAGFIGSNLVRSLVREGSHQVLNIDALTYAGNLSSLQGLGKDHGYEFLQADICDAQAMDSAFSTFQPDWVMHLAAESHVDRSITGPAEFVRTNVAGTQCLLEAARKHYNSLPESKQELFRFLHVSTDEVYGTLGEEGEFSEKTPYDPRSPYSASKAASDHLARAWHHTYGLPVLVTNCSNNYGPYQHPEKLIPVVILNALRGKPIPVYGTGANVRDWLHVEDHVAALQLVAQKGRPGETYNIGGSNEQRNIELVKLICSIMDELRPMANGEAHASLIELVTDRLGHDFRYAIDSRKIQSELDWRPTHGHPDGIRSTVEWYLDHPQWIEDALGNERAKAPQSS